MQIMIRQQRIHLLKVRTHRLLREQKQQIMSLIKQKEVEQLGASSIDDLKALLASL